MLQKEIPVNDDDVKYSVVAAESLMHDPVGTLKNTVWTPDNSDAEITVLVISSTDDANPIDGTRIVLRVDDGLCLAVVTIDIPDDDDDGTEGGY
jgi:hypothetical protein